MGDFPLWELMEHGGPVMWPLLAASVLGLAVILERCIVFAAAYQRLGPVVRALQPLIRQRAWARAEQFARRRGPLTQVARVYLARRDQPEKVREDVLRREGTLLLAHLEKRLRLLAALAQVGTLLGLLGTFYFMIYKFHPAASAGGQIQQSDFFAAIWESFLSTMFGLCIAIPCMTAFQLFEGRVDVISRQMSVLVSYLDEWRREGEEPVRASRPSRHEPLPASEEPIIRS